jgi:hypothetical protein
MSLIPPDPSQPEPEPAVVRLTHAFGMAILCGALVALFIMSYAETSLALADQQLLKAQEIDARANAVMSEAEAIRAQAAEICGGDL